MSAYISARIYSFEMGKAFGPNPQTHRLTEVFQLLLSRNASLVLTSFLPHIYDIKLSTTVQNNSLSNELSLKITWMPASGLLRSFASFVGHIPPRCNRTVQNEICLNFSSASADEKTLDNQSKYYFVLFKTSRRPQKRYIKSGIVRCDKNNPKKKSWNEGFHLCGKVGGTLPIIRDRAELEELIAFTRFAPAADLTEALFIGVDSQVRKELFVCFNYSWARTEMLCTSRLFGQLHVVYVKLLCTHQLSGFGELRVPFSECRALARQRSSSLPAMADIV